MADRDLKVDLDIDAQGAIRGLGDVADAAEHADQKIDAISDAEITVAVDTALGNVDDLIGRISRLNQADQKIVLEAETVKAQQSVKNLEDKLKDIRSLSDTEVDILLRVRDEASSRLDVVQAKAKELDATTVDVEVDSSGVDDLLGKLGEMPGKFGEIGSALQGLSAGPAGVAGLAAGLGAAMFAMAQDVATAAGEVKVLQTLTGASAEDVSRLRAAFANVNVEASDLADIVLQVNGVLTDTPQLAKDLGVHLGSDVVKNFEAVVTATENIADPMKRAATQSKIFGEEGVRQVAALTAKYGSLNEGLAQVNDNMIFDEEQIRDAQEFQRVVDQITSKLQAMSQIVGTELINNFTQLKALIEDINGLIPKIPGLPDDLMGNIKESLLESTPILGEFLAQRKLLGLFGDDAETAGKQTAQAAGNFAEMSSAMVDATDAAEEFSATDPALPFDLIANSAEDARVAMYEASQANKDFAREFSKAMDKSTIDTLDEVADRAGTFGKIFEDVAASAAAPTNLFIEMVDANKAWGEALKENGKTLDLSTEKGRDNFKVLEAQAGVMRESVTQTMLLTNSTDEAKKKAAEYETQLRKQLKQIGLNDKEVDGYIKTLGLTPEQVETTIKLNEAEEARKKIELLQGAIDKLPPDVQTKVTQQIIAGDYVGAVKTVQTYNDQHPTSVDVKAEATGMADAHKAVLDYFKERPLSVPVTLVVSNANLPAGVTQAKEGGIPASTTTSTRTQERRNGTTSITPRTGRS